MITLYGFGTIFPDGIGETKDLRAQWALEESGLPYKVHAIDHDASEHEGPAYSKISPFHQVPVIVDDGFAVAESAAVLLYIAEKAHKLIPSDARGRWHVTQWCFAAVATVAPVLQCMDMIEIFDAKDAAPELVKGVREVADRFLGDVERRLDGREWIAVGEFTVADILMAHILRGLRKTDIMKPYPRMQAYYERCLARPAWERTLEMYAKRLGVTVDSIR